MPSNYSGNFYARGERQTWKTTGGDDSEELKVIIYTRQVLVARTRSFFATFDINSREDLYLQLFQLPPKALLVVMIISRWWALTINHQPADNSVAPFMNERCKLKFHLQKMTGFEHVRRRMTSSSRELHTFHCTKLLAEAKNSNLMGSVKLRGAI